MPVQWLPGDNFIANSYIYGDTLIDAGIHPMAVERYRDRIKVIVLTHCHFDHTARVREIAAMCNAKVAIHSLDAPALMNDLKSVAIFFGERAPSITSDVLLSEGDSIGLLKVLHTPGHTPGSICLYDAENRILFSGDTVFTEGSFGRYDLPGGNFQSLKSSIRRISSLDIEGLYPGHGIPVHEGGRGHIAAAQELLKDAYG